MSLYFFIKFVSVSPKMTSMKIKIYLLAIPVLLNTGINCFSQSSKSDLLLKQSSEYRDIGDLTHALKCAVKALELFTEAHDKKGEAKAYSRIGILYYEQGDYTSALENDMKALDLHEETSDKKGMATVHNNIGIIYFREENHTEALKEFFAALKLKEELGDKRGIAVTLMNIGNIYDRQADYPKALEYNMKALKLNEEAGDQQGIAHTYSNIGIIYYEQGNYSESLKNEIAGLRIMEETNELMGIAPLEINIAKTYLKQKKINDAMEYLNKALVLAKKSGNKDLLKDCYENLTHADSIMLNFGKALNDHNLFIAYRDSISNEENEKKMIRLEMQQAFDKKEALVKMEKEQKDIAAELLYKNEQKNITVFWIGLISIIIIIVGIVIFRSTRQKQIDDMNK